MDPLKSAAFSRRTPEADIKEFGSHQKKPRDIARGFAISELALLYCGPNR
jgi:hypothetical protein